VYSEWVTTQLKGGARKHRLYRLANERRKSKACPDQWTVVHGVILHQATVSLRKSIISRSVVAIAAEDNAYALSAEGESASLWMGRVCCVLFNCERAGFSTEIKENS